MAGKGLSAEVCCGKHVMMSGQGTRLPPPTLSPSPSCFHHSEAVVPAAPLRCLDTRGRAISRCPPSYFPASPVMIPRMLWTCQPAHADHEWVRLMQSRRMPSFGGAPIQLSLSFREHFAFLEIEVGDHPGAGLAQRRGGFSPSSILIGGCGGWS